VLCKVSYDGSNYHGWQRQENALSVQAVIEESLKQIHDGTNILTHGASRTDQGVHALGQMFHFDTSIDLPIERMALAINTYLPEDVFIVSAAIVPSSFHARKSAKLKTYCYKMMVDTYQPHQRNFMGFIKGPIDLARMQSELKTIMGTHNFSSFTQNATYDSYERTISFANIKATPYGFELLITGNGFLRHMVRILIGTLVQIGQGHEDSLQTILKSEDRQRAGMNVAPEGLYLLQVEYE
jgi:tRNA pseudouridine38-40 synthase